MKTLSKLYINNGLDKAKNSQIVWKHIFIPLVEHDRILYN